MAYIGKSRSVRSAEAMNDGKLPISLINKKNILAFAKSDACDPSVYGDVVTYNPQIFKLPLYDWKDVANVVGPSEWHHTGEYFRKTDYYDLNEISAYLTKHYKAYNKRENISRNNSNSELDSNFVTLVVINVDDWGGTRERPRIIGCSTVVGFLKCNWVIAYNTDQSRYSTLSHRVNWEYDFNNLIYFKRFLGKDVDLRKFKKFLREHHVKAHYQPCRQRQQKRMRNLINEQQKISKEVDSYEKDFDLYDLSHNHKYMTNKDKIDSHYNHGLYPFTRFSWYDKLNHYGSDNKLLKFLMKIGIMRYHNDRWYVNKKYNPADDFFIYDNQRCINLYTPMFFRFLDEVCEIYGICI